MAAEDEIHLFMYLTLALSSKGVQPTSKVHVMHVSADPKYVYLMQFDWKSVGKFFRFICFKDLCILQIRDITYTIPISLCLHTF